MSFGRCHVTRKVSHATRSGAKDHAKEVRRRYKRQGKNTPVNIYHCRFCDCYHIGSWHFEKERQ